MVNVSELMLGNWVMYLGEYAVITLLHPERIEINTPMKKIKCDPSAEEVTPIPLTPELMEKLGWHCTENTRHKKCYKPTEKKSDLDGLVFNFGAYDFVRPKNMHYNIIAIRYLHELQNQYRWENGKPLLINLFDIKE